MGIESDRHHSTRGTDRCPRPVQQGTMADMDSVEIADRAGGASRHGKVDCGDSDPVSSAGSKTGDGSLRESLIGLPLAV